MEINLLLLYMEKQILMEIPHRTCRLTEWVSIMEINANFYVNLWKYGMRMMKDPFLIVRFPITPSPPFLMCLPYTLPLPFFIPPYFSLLDNPTPCKIDRFIFIEWPFPYAPIPTFFGFRIWNIDINFYDLEQLFELDIFHI